MCEVIMYCSDISRILHNVSLDVEDYFLLLKLEMKMIVHFTYFLKRVELCNFIELHKL